MMADWTRGLIAVPAILVIAACGAEDAAVADTAGAGTASEAPATAAPEPGVSAADGTGEVIEIRMNMANGGSFEPAEVTARPGDVLRFVNVENVHNVSFPATRNGGASRLPPASPYLTSPGETYELTVDLEAGSYTFQCDPHAAMGMVGTLSVE